MNSSPPARLRYAVPLLSLVMVTAACGSKPALSASAAVILQKDAAALAAAAGAGNRTQISVALATLQADVERQRTAGQLTAEREKQILDASARVAADAPLATPTVSPTTTRPTLPVTSPSPTQTPTYAAPVVATPPAAPATSSSKPGHGAPKSHGKPEKGKGPPGQG